MIDKHSAHGTRDALEVIEAILVICGSLELGKNTWQAEFFEENPVIIQGKKPGAIGMYVTPVGVRIQRKKPVIVPKNQYQKLMQGLKEMLEPVIIIRPIFHHAHVRSLSIDLVINKRRFSHPKDSWMTLLFRKDLLHIFKIIKQDLAKEMKFFA